MKTTTKINQKSREREREETETETAKRPDWVMKSWTALNINEFILFEDIFGVQKSFAQHVLEIFAQFGRFAME